MSNEDFYENESDLDFNLSESADEGMSDYFEVELKRRAPKGDVFFQIFSRTRHWIRMAVRPQEILREDKNDNIFSFVKRLRDPHFNPQDGVRYINFRCNILVSELEVDMTFTSIGLCYEDVNGKLTAPEILPEGAEECDEVKQVFEMVIDNLAQYLSKS